MLLGILLLGDGTVQIWVVLLRLSFKTDRHYVSTAQIYTMPSYQNRLYIGIKKFTAQMFRKCLYVCRNLRLTQ
jgi:hypothetical protein